MHMCVYLFCYMAIIKLSVKPLFWGGSGVEGKEILLNGKPISDWK